MSGRETEFLSKYKKALFHAKVGFWELDFTTMMMSWDEGIHALYENETNHYTLPLDYFYGRIHPDDSVNMRAEIENARLDLSNLDSLFRITILNGKSKYIRTNAIRLYNEKNEVVSLVGMNWDVTNEYQLQEDLQKTKIFLEKIVEAIPDPIFIKDSSHRIIFLNSAFEKICNISRENILGRVDSEFLPKEVAERYWKQDDEILFKNNSLEYEEVYIDKLGAKSHFLTKKTAVHISDDERVLVGVIRDITEIKNIQKSMIEQSKMASLGEMAAGIAHEINNPLMIIQAKSQILQHRLVHSAEGDPLSSEKFSSDLNLIELNSLRIDKIIKSLKSISRKSNADAFEEVSILDIIEEAMELSQDRFCKAKVDLSFNYDEIIDSSYRVRVRSSEIVQVMVNLLNNSFDAVKNKIPAWVRIYLDLFETTFRIEVMDSGEPIRPEIAKKMMDPFFTTKMTGAGTGLGLSVSQQILKNHNGDLFYDKMAANTKFVFHLKRTESISNL